MRKFDVIVVGGGPAGAVTARVAAKAGATVLLLERRSQIEEPSACAGLVSPRTLSVLGASEACVVRRLRDATFHAPGGTVLSVHATSDRALVVDRSTLERELLARARDAGVEVRLGVSATAWTGGALEMAAPDGKETAAAAVLVGADGPESRVALWCGLRSFALGLSAAQAEVESAPEGDRVDVFVGRHVAPGFFAWSIPAQAGRLRVGLAVSSGVPPAPFLDRLLESRFPDRRVVARVEGTIPVPLPADGRIAGGGALLVGDAAAQVKPLSGGGLYFGGLCARLAGRAASRAAREARDRETHLERYETACHELLGPETRFGLAARSARDALDDADWDRLFSLLNRSDLLAVVSERIDIDHLRHMVPPLVSHPRLWGTLFTAWDLVRRRLGAEGGVAGSRDECL